MAQKKPRPATIITPVQLRSEHGAKIADADLHGVSRRALRLARDVVGGPREDDSGGRVDARGGEDGADVGEARGCRGGGEEDDVADDGEGRGG